MEALRLMLGYATGTPSGYFMPPAHTVTDTIPVTTSASPSPPPNQIRSATPSTNPTPTNGPMFPLPIPPTSLLTRISESNVPSIKLFEKLGFRISKRVEVFGEVEMRWGT